jgi:hypothetical protein
MILAARDRARETRDTRERRDVNKLDFYLFSPVPLVPPVSRAWVFQHPAKESIEVLSSGRTRGWSVSAPFLAPPVSA